MYSVKLKLRMEDWKSVVESRKVSWGQVDTSFVLCVRTAYVCLKVGTQKKSQYQDMHEMQSKKTTKMCTALQLVEENHYLWARVVKEKVTGRGQKWRRVGLGLQVGA